METNIEVKQYKDKFGDFYRSYMYSSMCLTKKQRNKIYETLLLNLEVYPQFSCLDFLEYEVFFTVNSAYSMHDEFPISMLHELNLFAPVWDKVRQYETYPKRGCSWFVEKDESDPYHTEHKRIILLFCYMMTL